MDFEDFYYPPDALQFFIEESLLGELEHRMAISCLHFEKTGDFQGVETFSIFYSDLKVGYFGDLECPRRHIHGYEVIISGAIFAVQGLQRKELLTWLKENDQFED